MNEPTFINFRNREWLCVLVLLWECAAGLANANPTVDQQPVGPDGQMFGGSLSPKGLHFAVLAAKGSHYAIIVDGVEGPKIDNLIFNVGGSEYRIEALWGNAPIPVIFSKDGAHWAYMAKQGDNYLVMLDGKEFAHGPINKRGLAGSLNLTFSVNGQHLFWSDVSADGKYVIVADGKAGPPSQYLPQLALSPNGNHYAYASFNRDGTGAWSFVDGKQVDFFGDNLKYTAKDVLMSTLRTPDRNVELVLDGKPLLKAASINQTWISDDGRQIALVITPGQGAATLLTVNGKPVPGTEGLPVEKVFFSPDGKRYAALCTTKTGAKFMMIDGKKGEEYQAISTSAYSINNETHWRFVTWIQNQSIFPDFQPPVPGFTADSSKFVYVSGSGGRQFAVINDQESNPFGDTLAPILSAVDNHVAVYGITPDKSQHIILDGKDMNIGTSVGVQRLSQLTFSPHATHYGYIAGNYNVYLDGAIQPGTVNGSYVFSPDDKHFAYQSNTGGKSQIVCDGKVVNDKAGMVNHIFFSPDSKHIYWISSGNLAVLGMPGTKDSTLLFVDGKPVTHYSDNATFLDPLTDSWTMLHPEFSDDGTMTFYARTDGNVRKFRVKSDTDLATVLASAPAMKAN